MATRFRLMGLSEEQRLEIEQASGGTVTTEAARAIVDAATENTGSQLQAMMDESLKEIQSIIGPHGSVTRLQAGGIHITPGDGIGIYADGVLKTTMKTSGDLAVGSDIESPNTTTLYCFVTDELYNNEDMGAGDMLIGDNTDGISNVKYDASEGQLQFRYGTTVQAYMDTDGSIKAGGGDVSIDNTGVWVKNQQGVFGFEDTTDTRFNLYLLSDATDNLVIKNKLGVDQATGSGGVRVEVDSGTHKVLSFKFEEDPAVDEVPFLLLSNTDPSYTGVGKIIIATGVKLVSGVTGGETVFNDNAADVDFRIESVNDTNAVRVDAATDRVSFFGAPSAVTTPLTMDGGTDKRAEFGADHYIPIRSSPNPNVCFNEANQDMDFIVEGDNSGYLLYLDAGQDKATSFQWDGWAKMDHHTWTRTGNHTFTVSGDVTATYCKDTKVRYKDGGAYEYGVIGSSSYSSPNTTVTLITNTDYAMAAATITDNYLSNTKKPEGFPEWFNWAAAPTNFTGTYVAKWKAINDMLKFEIELSSTSTVAGAVTITLPIAHTRGTATPVLGVGYFLDTGNASYPGQLIAISTTTARPVAFPYNPTSATNPLYVTQSYMAAAVPFTWGNTDAAQFAGEYPY
jgi:hypothetical protein